MTPRLFSFMVKRYERRFQQEDRRAGEIVAMIYNANRDSEKDPKGLAWRDFFPEWREPVKEQTEEEMLDLMRLFAAKSTEGLSH